MKHTTAKIEVDVQRIGRVSLKQIFNDSQIEKFQEELAELARADDRAENMLPVDDLFKLVDHYRNAEDNPFESVLDRLVFISGLHKIDVFMFHE